MVASCRLTGAPPGVLSLSSAAPALCTPNPRGRLVFLCCSPSLGGRGPVSQASILSPPPPPPPPTAGEGNSALSPLNPGELLIALHNIDSAKCDMKSIIKGEAPRPRPAPTPSSVAWPLRTQGRTLGWSRPPLESAKSETVPRTAPSQSSGRQPRSFHPSSSPSFPPTPSEELMHPLRTSLQPSGKMGEPSSPVPRGLRSEKHRALGQAGQRQGQTARSRRHGTGRAEPGERPSRPGSRWQPGRLITVSSFPVATATVHLALSLGFAFLSASQAHPPSHNTPFLLSMPTSIL